MSDNDKNFEFGSEQQYPTKSDPYSRMIYDLVRRIQTIPGVKGDIPAHEWNETRVRFENPDGSWGQYVDLAGMAGTAPAIQAEYSVDGLTNWHVTYAEGDKYFRFSYDAGSTWGAAIPFGGQDGFDGDPGENAPYLKIQYSANGSVWNYTPSSGDKYFRFSNDDGATWGAAVYFFGNTGNNAPNVLIQYSIDGGTWHSDYNSGVDKYIRFSVDNGSTWEVSDRFIGIDGEPGADGTNQYLYIAWADDTDGNGFTMTHNPTKFYRAEIQSTTIIASPTASNFAGKWKYIKGENGADGQNVYRYIGYASDASGSNFTLTNDISLDYMAILLSYTYIESPVVGDFAGLWFKRKGDNGSNAEYIELPTATTVHGRITEGIIEQPTGWNIDSADQLSNPLSSNPSDLIIQHNTGKEVISVEIKSKISDRQIHLIGATAFGGWEDDDEKNYLCIKSFSETETTIGIYIMFES